MSTHAPDRAASRSDDEALTAQQMKQAEELLFSEPPREGFAKAVGASSELTGMSNSNLRAC